MGFCSRVFVEVCCGYLRLGRLQIISAYELAADCDIDEACKRGGISYNSAVACQAHVQECYEIAVCMMSQWQPA